MGIRRAWPCRLCGLPARCRGGKPTVPWPRSDNRTAVHRLPVTRSTRAHSCPPNPHDRKSMNLDINALETSFDHIAARGDQLVDVFYQRLFDVAPSVQPLLAGTDLKRQKGMLLAA